MNRPRTEQLPGSAQTTGPHRLSTRGLVAGAAAAIGYTLAATFLRELSKSVDPAWVSAMKAVCTTAVFLPVLLFFAYQGNRILPPIKQLCALIGAGILVQLAGNLSYQWALGIIGMALVVPLTMGTMVISSAIGGWLILRERVTLSMSIALVILIFSVVLLSFGGKQAGQEVGHVEGQPWLWILAGLAACAAGFSYSMLGISIRASLRSTIPLATPMVIVGLCGLVILGSVSLGRLGWQVVETTNTRSWILMCCAGLCNSLAFLALSYSLKRLPVIYVNAINVSQVAMAALIGIYFFAEPMSGWLTSGLLAMLIGFFWMGRKRMNNRSQGGKPSGQLKSDDKEPQRN